VVDPGSARELVRIDQPQFNHNAGCMNFGPDGMLYIALGDGGGRDDRDDGVSLGVPLVGHGCEGNGQDIETILGSIIRIDVDGSDSITGQYGIPADNPFVGTDGLDEIYAYGFRNPWRFSFDSATGALYVPDVGQNDLEEINVVTSGGNYGWRYKEGSFTFVFNGNEPGYVTDMPLDTPAGLIDPIAEYDHDEGTAIVGGFAYRGAKIPALAGRYVFGEFAQTFSNDGRLFYLDETDQIREFELVDQDQLGLSLLGFGQDASGELYVLANSTGVPFGDTGVVLKMKLRDGDMDGDGDVDLGDLATMLASYDLCAGDPGFNPVADIDDSGCVDLSDLATLLASYGS
jgi:glucose/arabinose dehydrogenase